MSREVEFWLDISKILAGSELVCPVSCMMSAGIATYFLNKKVLPLAKVSWPDNWDEWAKWPENGQWPEIGQLPSGNFHLWSNHSKRAAVISMLVAFLRYDY